MHNYVDIKYVGTFWTGRIRGICKEDPNLNGRISLAGAERV